MSPAFLMPMHLTKWINRKWINRSEKYLWILAISIKTKINKCISQISKNYICCGNKNTSPKSKKSFEKVSRTLMKISLSQTWKISNILSPGLSCQYPVILQLYVQQSKEYRNLSWNNIKQDICTSCISKQCK